MTEQRALYLRKLYWTPLNVVGYASGDEFKLDFY